MPPPRGRGKQQDAEDGLEEELVDLTAPLVLRSKKTDRLQKKQKEKTLKQSTNARGIASLPWELVFQILSFLRPSDLWRFSRINRYSHGFVEEHKAELAHKIINYRYSTLRRCFFLPVRRQDLDPAHKDVLDGFKTTQDATKKKYHWAQHIPYQDDTQVCTCVTCSVQWSSLCNAVDFAHWQQNLDTGEPIPMIQRGSKPEWNQHLVDATAGVVRRALDDPLWYASLLEAHLNSTVRSVRRHTNNKGNKRRHFELTRADEESGTDFFLTRRGPNTTEIPFHRDNFYMLEVFMPNRGWITEREAWVYVPPEQHRTDLERLTRMLAERRRAVVSEIPRQEATTQLATEVWAANGR
jgi:hypothetical protein